MGRPLLDHKRKPTRVVAAQHKILIGRQRMPNPAEISRHRQLATTAVNEHRQPYTRRSTIVENFIQGRSHRTPGKQNIVDQQNIRPLYFESEGVDLRSAGRPRRP